MELRADPAALAPERLLVFEVRGSIATFAAAVRNVPGLELVDEEELEADQDKNPAVYLMVPDVRALHELESLWQRWLRGDLKRGPWPNLFSLLRDLRPWGPQDRVLEEEVDILAAELADRAPSDLIRLELELVYRGSAIIGAQREEEVRRTVGEHQGHVIASSRIDDIGYHALLVDLPVRSVQEIITRSPKGIAGLEQIMHVRPQSTASTVEVGDARESGSTQTSSVQGDPIVALLDGVPVAAHRLLSNQVVLDDQFDLARGTLVADRTHGTAMASLIVHGDRNRAGPVLPRRIHIVPVLGAGERFPPDRLIVDMIYTAIVAMRDGEAPTAPHVVLVNLSLGNSRRPFQGALSPWARLLDRLAYRYGLLFIVSAGNCTTPLPIPGLTRHMDFEEASAGDRAAHTLRALGAIVADRRLFSPSETVNGITVGASNEDAVAPADRAQTRMNVDPFGELRTANPSSALGPGFARSVKPDILLPGAREHLRFQATRDDALLVVPAGPGRPAGLLVAAPPRQGIESAEGYTGGTSAAAALGSRTAHRIHDALEAAYGEAFLALNHHQRAVLLKALLAHPATWPAATASLIREVIGPKDNKLHVRQKDNIRRFLGYGIVDAEDAVACADDRAVFWAAGVLEQEKAVSVSVPIPTAMNAKTLPHTIAATLAWFTPTWPGRRSYRAVRLNLLGPATELDALRLDGHGNQPDVNQTRRGTLLTRCWSGDRAPAVAPNMIFDLTIQREPDQGLPIDEPIPFGLAVTVAMPGVVEIYAQAHARSQVRPRLPL